MAAKVVICLIRYNVILPFRFVIYCINSAIKITANNTSKLIDYQDLTHHKQPTIYNIYNLIDKNSDKIIKKYS